jgi:death-on-curing protein
MATDRIRYISYPEAVLIHIELMRLEGEIRYGVFERRLVESALARPQQAAAYEAADIIRQTATLCWGLIKYHPWIGGNKRTATALVRIFLSRNHYRLMSTTAQNVAMVLAVESDQWGVETIESSGCENTRSPSSREKVITHRHLLLALRFSPTSLIAEVRNFQADFLSSDKTAPFPSAMRPFLAAFSSSVWAHALL